MFKLCSYVVHCRELSHSSNIDLQEQMNGNKVFCESSVLFLYFIHKFRLTLSYFVLIISCVTKIGIS